MARKWTLFLQPARDDGSTPLRPDETPAVEWSGCKEDLVPDPTCGSLHKTDAGARAHGPTQATLSAMTFEKLSTRWGSRQLTTPSGVQHTLSRGK